MTSSNAPERVTALTGSVLRAPFARGSKSERQGIWLQTGDRRLLLRLKGGPSFGDAKLERLVGKTVSCDGFVLDHQFLAERITELD